MTSEAKEPSNEVDELAAWLIHMADMGDMGRKPDPTCSKRRAAVMLVTLNAEVERWINAYNIAHDQAMDNGRALADCRKCLIKMGENAGTAYKEYAAELATLRARLEVAEAENVRLREAVRKAEQVFYHYADLHMKKGTADGNQKGAVNLAYSMEMGEALAQQENET